MKFKLLAGCEKTPLHRHSREGGSPEGFKKTGFPLPRERHYWTVKDFFSTLLEEERPNG